VPTTIVVALASCAGICRVRRGRRPIGWVPLRRYSDSAWWWPSGFWLPLSL